MNRAALYTLLLPFLCFLNAKAQVPKLNWGYAIGGTAYDEGISTACDENGNVYTTGLFSQTADFDPSAAIYELSAVKDYDVFISKTSPDGQLIWAKRIGGKFRDQPTALTIDQYGHVLISGFFGDTIDFDPGPGVFNVAASTSSLTPGVAGFLLKLDTAGDFVWVKTINALAYSITTGHNGVLYATGSFLDTTDFDPGTGVFNLIADTRRGRDEEDIFVLKLDSNGDFRWAKSFGSKYQERPSSIILDDSGNVYTAGNFLDTVDFDPGPGSFVLSTGFNLNGYILKLDSLGDFIWAKALGGGVSTNHPKKLVLDHKGTLYIVGGFLNTCDFDPGAGEHLLSTPAGTGTCMYIAKLHTDGSFKSAIMISGTGSSIGNDACIDSSGNLYICGFYTNKIDFDPGPGTVYHEAAFLEQNAFVQKLDSASTLLWVRNFQSSKTIRSNSLSIDGQRAVSLTGFFNGTISFGPDGGTPAVTAAASDIFLLRVKEERVLFDATEQTQDSYLLYPNPATEAIQLYLPQNQGLLNVKVLNNCGQLILEKKISGNTATIPTGSFLPGVYLIHIYENARLSATKQFVKQ